MRKKIKLVFVFFISSLGARGGVLFASSILITFLAGALYSAAPIFLARLADLITAGPAEGSFGTLVILSGLYLISVAGQKTAATISLYLDSVLRMEGLKQVSRTYFDYVSNQDQTFFTNTNSGSLGSHLNQINNEFYTIVRSLVSDVIGPITQLGTAGIILVTSGQWLIALFFLAYCVAFVVNHAIFTRKLVSQKLAMMDAGRRSYQVLTDSISNIPVAKQYNARDYLAKRYETQLNDDKAVQSRFWSINLSMMGVSSGLYIVLFSASFIYAALSAANGTITVGQFVLIASYILMLTAPIEALGDMFGRLTQAIAAFANFLESVSEKHPGTARIQEGGLDIEFQDVCFAYPGANNTHVLNGFTTSIPTGQRLAITGTSGSGKSTILRLLAGHYQPSAGTVSIGGIAVDDADPSSLNSCVNLVSQDALVFMDTLRFNVAIANPSASEREVLEALGRAGLSRFVSTLPSGMETELGDRGATVSGGQKQRIAIARLFLASPAIILLDEATAGLDVDTERDVILNLFSAFPNATIIGVSHRASTIKLFDRALVLEEGRLVADGDPSELSEHSEFFKRVMLQSEQEPA
ncbi:ABC transporter ATP-binding protein [Pelagibacterium halotolerans]|uniref:ABC transporter ATP-binding protein n=1 Tax=Pelagibacterium halotolerans TaxID=531813 RepID=UPI00384CA9D9